MHSKMDSFISLLSIKQDWHTKSEIYYTVSCHIGTAIYLRDDSMEVFVPIRTAISNYYFQFVLA